MSLLAICAPVIAKLLAALPSFGVLRDHVEFLRNQIEIGDSRIKSLEKTVADLSKENTELRRGAAEHQDAVVASYLSEDFIEHTEDGALFKRMPDGTIKQSVYCPRCRQVAGTSYNLPYACDPCRWNSTITPRTLAAEIAKTIAARGGT